MKTLELNKMEGIEGGASNGNASNGNGYACAGGIIVTVALGAFAFANPLAAFILAPEMVTLGALAAGAIAENC
jgi:hypothetical protein